MRKLLFEYYITSDETGTLVVQMKIPVEMMSINYYTCHVLHVDHRQRWSAEMEQGQNIR